MVLLGGERDMCGVWDVVRGMLYPYEEALDAMWSLARIQFEQCLELEREGTPPINFLVAVTCVLRPSFYDIVVQLWSFAPSLVSGSLDRGYLVYLHVILFQRGDPKCILCAKLVGCLRVCLVWSGVGNVLWDLWCGAAVVLGDTLSNCLPYLVFVAC